MTTLTHKRDSRRIGGYDQILLRIDGPAGVLMFRFFTGSGGDFIEGVWVCSRTERAGAEYEERCDISGGPCWGDWLGRQASTRLLAAWHAGGEHAAYEMLEVLYRQQFGDES